MYILYLLENATERAGRMNLKEPPITTGSRVPNNVCKSVLIPEVNSKLCTTWAFSTLYISNFCEIPRKPQKLRAKTYK